MRHRPRSLEDSGGRSPLIIKNLNPYPQPPTNTRSPTLNTEEPQEARAAGVYHLAGGCVVTDADLEADAARFEVGESTGEWRIV